MRTYYLLRGKSGFKPEKIDFSIMSQVIILLNLCRKTTLYLKSIHKNYILAHPWLLYFDL